MKGDGQVLQVKSATSLQLQVNLATFHQMRVKSGTNPVRNNLHSVTSFFNLLFFQNNNFTHSNDGFN